MEPSTQKLIHTFGALADLGQEIAGTGDFTEMVRTSMHLLLGTLALRRGAVVECAGPGPLHCVALWGLGDHALSGFEIEDAESRLFFPAIQPSRWSRTSRRRTRLLNRHRESWSSKGSSWCCRWSFAVK